MTAPGTLNDNGAVARSGGSVVKEKAPLDVRSRGGLEQQDQYREEAGRCWAGVVSAVVSPDEQDLTNSQSRLSGRSLKIANVNGHCGSRIDHASSRALSTRWRTTGQEGCAEK